MNPTIRNKRGTSGSGRRTTVALVATTALALGISACGGGGAGGGAGGAGNGATPGVTDSKITIGTTQPLTGPAAAGYASISDAMKAYFAYVNDNGGINGRSVDLIVEDDGYNPTTTVEKTKKLILQDKVFALVGGLGTPTHTAVLDLIRQNKVPDIMVSSGSLSWNQPDKYPMTWGWPVDYVREGKILAAYAKEKFPGKTYCSYGQGDDLGSDGVVGVEKTLGEGTLKAKELYTASNTNVAPQIGKLQAAGCEVIFSFSLPGFNALALSTSAQLGYEAQWVVSSIGGDPAALKGYLKDSAGTLTEGLVAGAYLPNPSDTDNSWNQLFQKINDKYNDGAEYDTTLMHGFALAYSVAQALLAAGEEPTRESLIEAMKTGGFTGPALTPFAYSEKDHSGMKGIQVVTIKDLKAEPASPVYVTDDGEGAVEEYDTPQPEAPTGGIPD